MTENIYRWEGYEIRYTEGTRLGDIYQIGIPGAIECVQVAQYDWVRGKVITGTANPEAALREWVESR
jgi:hypothetical protein